MAKPIVVPDTRFTPRDYQLKLYQYLETDNGIQRALLVWPRQIGKDTACFAFMAKKAVENPGNYFYVFPTKEMARKAVWEKVFQEGTLSGMKLVSLLPKELISRHNNQEMLLECSNGSTIRMIGLDTNPDAIRGVTPLGIVFSEFAYSDPEAYKAVIPALRNKDAWMIINSTPNGRNHFYDMYQGTTDSKAWYTSFLQALYPDRANFIYVHPPEYFEQLVSEGVMTWEDLEREYGCSWSAGIKGSYYVDYIQTAFAEGRVGLYPHNSTKVVDTFWDLGVDDSTAIWFRQIDGNGIIWIDYYESSGKGLDHFIDVLKEKRYKYGTHYVPHDAGRRQQGRVITTTAEQLDIGLSDMEVSGEVEVCQKPFSKQDGINAVRKRFSKFYFNKPKVHDGLEKLELYHRKYDKKRGSFLEQPVHDRNSHAADAFRLEAEVMENMGDAFFKQDDLQVISKYNLFEE